MKKLTAMILTLALALSLLPTDTLAANVGDGAKIWESEKRLEMIAGEEYTIVLQGMNMENYAVAEFRLSYDRTSVEIVDACVYTSEKELNVGKIEGTKITVTSMIPGELRFLAETILYSGPINVVTIKALRNTETTFNLSAYKYNTSNNLTGFGGDVGSIFVAGGVIQKATRSNTLSNNGNAKNRTYTYTIIFDPETSYGTNITVYFTKAAGSSCTISSVPYSPSSDLVSEILNNQSLDYDIRLNNSGDGTLYAYVYPNLSSDITRYDTYVFNFTTERYVPIIMTGTFNYTGTEYRTAPRTAQCQYIAQYKIDNGAWTNMIDQTILVSVNSTISIRTTCREKTWTMSGGQGLAPIDCYLGRGYRMYLCYEGCDPVPTGEEDVNGYNVYTIPLKICGSEIAYNTSALHLKRGTTLNGYGVSLLITQDYEY